jgi:hypothetical protein
MSGMRVNILEHFAFVISFNHTYQRSVHLLYEQQNINGGAYFKSAHPGAHPCPYYRGSWPRVSNMMVRDSISCSMLTVGGSLRFVSLLTTAHRQLPSNALLP